MRIRRLILPITILCSLTATARSQGMEHYQDNDAANLQIWLDYNPSYPINNNFLLYGDVGARTIFPNIWYRFIARPSVKYQFLTFNEKTERYRAWELHGGIGLFYTANPENVDHLEIRPFQGLRVRIPNLDRFQLSHYLRLEERFEHSVGESINNFSMRFRYMAGSDFYFPGKFFMKGFYFPLYAEFFFNLVNGSQFNDVIRITPGLGYRPGEDWRIHLDLSYHRTRDTTLEGFKTHDIVFRLRVYQKF